MKLVILSVVASVSVLMLSSGAFAQGQTAVPFLLIAPDARAGGMGESGTAWPMMAQPFSGTSADLGS